MPRKPNLALERTIVDSALCLLDEEGLGAVTMREVAKAAHTTTPTLYERFKDQDALLAAVWRRCQSDFYDYVANTRSVRGMCDRFLEFCWEYPDRLDLVQKHWPRVTAAGDPRPTFDLLKQKLKIEFGLSGKRLDDVALATVSLMLGTALLMLNSGPDSDLAHGLQRSARKSLKVLCQSP